MLAARGVYRMFTDADGATPIAEVKRLEPALLAGADVVIGSRVLVDPSVSVAALPHRVAAGRGFNWPVARPGPPAGAASPGGVKGFSPAAAERPFVRLRPRRSGVDVVHLEFGEPDFEAPAVIREAVEKAVKDGRTRYTHSLGILPLREAIAEHYAATYGVNVSPDQILVTAGTSPAMLLLFGHLLDPGDEVVLNGFSKAYAMTGYRLGYVIAPRDRIRALQTLYGNFFISTSEFVQWAGVAALREAGEERRRFRARFDERRRSMLAGVRALGLGVACEPTGAFYVLANARHLGTDSVRLAPEVLEAAHVAVTPGAALGAHAGGYLRFSYAASLERIREGLARLGRFLTAEP